MGHMSHHTPKTKTLVFLPILFSASLQAFERSVDNKKFLPKNSVMVPHTLGEISVYRENGIFHAIQNGAHHKIEHYWTDPSLRNVSEKQLGAFLQKGYLAISQMSNGEFTLKAKVRGLGGGPITACCVYWGVKATAYTTAAVWVALGGVGTAPAVVVAGPTFVASVETAATASATAALGMPFLP